MDRANVEALRLARQEISLNICLNKEKAAILSHVHREAIGNPPIIVPGELLYPPYPLHDNKHAYQFKVEDGKLILAQPGSYFVR